MIVPSNREVSLKVTCSNRFHSQKMYLPHETSQQIRQKCSIWKSSHVSTLSQQELNFHPAVPITSFPPSETNVTCFTVNLIMLLTQSLSHFSCILTMLYTQIGYCFVCWKSSKSLLSVSRKQIYVGCLASLHQILQCYPMLLPDYGDTTTTLCPCIVNDDAVD